MGKGEEISAEGLQMGNTIGDEKEQEEKGYGRDNSRNITGDRSGESNG